MSSTNFIFYFIFFNGGGVIKEEVSAATEVKLKITERKGYVRLVRPGTSGDL